MNLNLPDAPGGLEKSNIPFGKTYEKNSRSHKTWKGPEYPRQILSESSLPGMDTARVWSVLWIPPHIFHPRHENRKKTT
jgi:hypothetical protein